MNPNYKSTFDVLRQLYHIESMAELSISPDTQYRLRRVRRYIDRKNVNVANHIKTRKCILEHKNGWIDALYNIKYSKFEREHYCTPNNTTL